MSTNRTGKICDAPGCDRMSRSGSSPYCETHYYRLRRGNDPDPLRPLELKCCLECGAENPAIGAKFCSRSCSLRYRRDTPAEKQRGRTPALAMVEAADRQWRDVPGFGDYEVSNDGRLRRKTPGSNSKAGRLIRATIAAHGYPQYGLTATGGKREYIAAHRLVAMAFLLPPAPDQPFVLHRNDDRLDVRDTNLKWGNAKDNFADAVRNGRVPLGQFHPSKTQPWNLARGDGHPYAKLTEDQVRHILRSPESAKTLGEQLDVHTDTVTAIRTGRNWRHITDPAYGAELIEGAKNFPPKPSKRKRFSVNQRFELLKRENYRCHLCQGLIYPGQGWDISHEIPIELGGADDESNRRAAHRKCHRVHTATVDIPAIARAKRIQAKHYAGGGSARPMPGGRSDTLKRKMDGTVVVRATGRPLFFRPARSAA